MATARHWLNLTNVLSARTKTNFPGAQINTAYQIRKMGDTGSEQTLSAAQLKEASDTCISHWQNGTTFKELPSSIRPKDVATAYNIQSHVERLTSKPLWGWKIAATSIHGQKHINVDRPLAGRILDERVTPYGQPVPLGPNRMLVAELEFVFRFGKTLEPRPGTKYEMSEVMDAVDGMFLGSEIPDSRYSDFTAVGTSQLIADNACADRFMLGPQITVDGWKDRDLIEHKVKGWVIEEDGEVGEVQEGKGGLCLGDPKIALTWIANELSLYGVPLKKGEYVTTGTCVVPLTVKPGVKVALDYGDLGRMDLEFIA